MRDKWTDRVREAFAKAFKDGTGAWIRIVIAVALASGIGATTTHEMAPSKADFNAHVERTELGFSNIGSEVADLGSDIGDLAGVINTVQDDAEQAQSQLNIVNATVANHTGEITTLGIRVTDVEIELETVMSTPPEGYLTGSFTLYTLHARASKTGNYTANINLVYSTPVGVGNATTCGEAMQAFYAGVNWTASAVRDYGCIPTCDNITWGISRVSFNIGTFNLVADTEKTIAVPFGGLNSTYKPDFSYVEVFPAFKGV